VCYEEESESRAHWLLINAHTTEKFAKDDSLKSAAGGEDDKEGIITDLLRANTKLSQLKTSVREL
jgi:hypothetical protein